MGACSGVLYGDCQVESYTNIDYLIGLCSMRGSRKTMEDSYCICLSIPNHETYSLFAIFDGFNGNQASKYLSNHLVNVLSKLKQLNDDKLIIDAINKMDQNFLKLKDINTAGSTIAFALVRAFESHNTSRFSSLSSMSSMSSISRPIAEIDPTSSYLLLKSLSLDDKVSFITPQQRYEVSVYWVGDSRSILVKNNNNYEELTVDHHCTLQKERARIMANNSMGTIINDKIDGITEMSRSFGCYSMKNNKKLKRSQQKQICVAGFKHLICDSNETLLLHSDGLTQKWTTKQLITKYKHHYHQTKDYKNQIQNTLNYLCEECIDDGSPDNITVIAVKFK